MLLKTKVTIQKHHKNCCFFVFKNSKKKKKIKYIIFKIVLRQVSKAFCRDLLEQFLKSLYFVM